MSRALYRILVHLHPRGFRDRFEEEMLAVYDDAVATRGGFRLAVSTLVSLVVQWLRPSPSHSMAASADTLRAFEIARTRQRLEISESSTGWAIMTFLMLPRLLKGWTPVGLAVLITLGLYGGYGVLHTLWRHVRTSQEYERASLRSSGLRHELARKATAYARPSYRVLPWFWAAVFAVCLGILLADPAQRHWNDAPAMILFGSALCFWHLRLQRRIGRVLKQELDELTDPAGPRT